jgi:conjugal transfer pilus assembly protein TrbC
VITDQDIERRGEAPHAHRRRTGPRAGAGAPRIDALPQPLTRRLIDLEALAKGYDAQGPAGSRRGLRAQGLLVFVSFSMPEATLTRLVDQAARARATLVLRGLRQRLAARHRRAHAAPDRHRQVAVQIDPQAFDRFSITRTPTFVLVRDGAASKRLRRRHVHRRRPVRAAAGDVSLDYALRYFERSAPGWPRRHRPTCSA